MGLEVPGKIFIKGVTWSCHLWGSLSGGERSGGAEEAKALRDRRGCNIIPSREGDGLGWPHSCPLKECSQ